MHLKSHNLFRQLISLGLLFGSFITFPAYAWQLEKNDRGVQVYTQQIEGSDFKAFRGTTRVQASIRQAVAFNMDLQKTPDWLHECKESLLLDRVNDREHYIYYVTDAPWPVSDRDYVLHSKIEQNPSTLEVIINFRAVTDFAKANDDCVRVTEITGHWKFTPEANGWLHVEYETHANPNGDIPAWLANSFVVDQPYYTLLNWREALLASSVDLSRAPFIKEAGTPPAAATQNNSTSP